MSYATQANALTLFMEGFKQDTGADLQRVPFQSGGEATNAVLGGHVPVGYFGIGNLLQHVRAGKIKMLAVDTPQRTPLYPEGADAGRSGLQGHPDPALVGPVRAGRDAASRSSIASTPR